MKKYIIGFLVGAIFTVSATAFADDIKSLVGKAIQGEAPVIVDGQQLDTAIIVDGKSYAPIRSIGEAAGYSVSVDGKKIILKSEVKDSMKTTSENLDKPRTLEDVTTVITRTQEKIERYKEAIQLYELNVSSSKTEEAKANSQLMLDSYKKQLAEAEQKLIDLEKQKAELESE
ncbi:hypothetical protein [Paenibacillus sp. IHB B 3415]|uniref:hypothetical protein n=1 Tax=Paenibacillus sp. IHB B 3415 TaxID=867080 RepID=UPI00069AB120|nr:hypothetical protein [Paenibacillus sp. IHB B 3415]